MVRRANKAHHPGLPAWRPDPHPVWPLAQSTFAFASVLSATTRLLDLVNAVCKGPLQRVEAGAHEPAGS